MYWDSPAGEPSMSARFPLGFVVECQGIIPAEISSWFRKFRGKEGEISKWTFPPPFPVESLGIFPHENFSRASLKNFKFNLMTKEGSQLCENIPLVIWCHSLVNWNVYRFGETFLSIQSQFKYFLWISTWIPVSLTTQISAWIPSTNSHQSPGIPHGIREISPAGLEQLKFLSLWLHWLCQPVLYRVSLFVFK